MDIKQQIDLGSIAGHYLYANTPNYLYRHFREVASIKILAEQMGVDALAHEYETIVRKPERTLEDVATAYAILVAFTFLTEDEADWAFSNIDLGALDWGFEIKMLFGRTHSVPNVETLEVKAKPFVYASAQGPASPIVSNIPTHIASVNYPNVLVELSSSGLQFSERPNRHPVTQHTTKSQSYFQILRA